MENIVYSAAVLIGINLVLGLLIKLFSFNKYIIISIAFAFGVLCLWCFEDIDHRSQLPIFDRYLYRIVVNFEITYLIMLVLFGIWHYKCGKLNVLKEIKIGFLVSTILFTVFYFLITNDVLHQYKKHFAKKETFVLQFYMLEDAQLIINFKNY